MTTLMQASAQFASRPLDERFASLLDLNDHTHSIRDRSQGKIISSKRLEFAPDPERPRTHLLVQGGGGAVAEPTHWSFGQLAALGGAPAGYLRTLPPPLIADCLNYGFKFKREPEDVGVLLTRTEPTQTQLATDRAAAIMGTGPEVRDTPIRSGIEIRAATGPRYGRIWNADITQALVDRFGDGVTGDWRVPGEFGKMVKVTKQNTTLFSSDRDMFVFLADEKNRIEIPGRRAGMHGDFARGFFVWNSEVGSQSIGAAFFLFDYTCCNRIVWGAAEYQEFRLRHTVSAPDKWLDQIEPVLIAYANSKTATVKEAIVAAQEAKLDDVDEFLKNRFSAKETSLFKQAHEREEGRPIETIWDAVTGITAHAKTIGFQDDRVALERSAGKVLDLVAA